MKYAISAKNPVRRPHEYPGQCGSIGRVRDLGGIARTSGYGDTSIEQNSYHPPAEMAGGAGYNQGFGIRRHDL